MKRYSILVAGALALGSGAALAAMGPQWGLPQNWTMSQPDETTGGYGAIQHVAGNNGSSMCVECHSVNPSKRIIDVEENNAHDTLARTNAATQGSHFVMNQRAGTGAAAPWGFTHSGGGFGGGYAGETSAPRQLKQYYRGASWSIGAESKYNSGTTLNSIYEISGSVGDTGADIICESCHNLVKNTVTNSDNDLLLGTYQDNVNDGICLGCHSKPGSKTETSADTAGYASFHLNDNLPAFSGASARKRHHVLTGDVLSDDAAHYGTTGVSSLMWAPSFSSRVSPEWCGTKYLPATSVTLSEITLNPATNIVFRNMCNVSGAGSRVYTQPQTLGDIRISANNAINCSNCHRPHNAESSSGAFILRLGNVAQGTFVGNVGGGKFSGQTNASIYYGIRRQFDVDSSYQAKVYQEYRPICDGCHLNY